MTGVSSVRLLELPDIVHGFFDRSGGVSTGLYTSLNCGLGSKDDPAHVAENRRRVAHALGIEPANLLTLYQIHSANAVTIVEAWPAGSAPQADGMATAIPGIALGVLAADCTPILFGDAEAKVIGACHAGWKGALAGVAEATIDAMVKLGASRDGIVASIGPTIRADAYEVGAEFRERFMDDDSDNHIWFGTGAASLKFQFNLPGYLTERLQRAGIGQIGDCGVCTYGDESYFSYRRATHRAEADYGRNISVIAIRP